MMRAVSITAVGTLIPALLLYLWRVSYALSDLAGIWLLFIGVLIFLGNRRLVLERWRAERRVVLREDSWVSKWMTGGVWAVVSSALLVAILIPALAWHALTMPLDVAGILCALAFASGGLFLAMRTFLMRHFMPPFDRVLASRPSTWLIGLPFAIILFYVTWHAADVPTQIISASFSDALEIDLHELPERSGLLSRALGLASAFDSAKLWLVAQARDYPKITAFYNLDMVLFGLLVARASIVITNFIETHYDGRFA